MSHMASRLAAVCRHLTTGRGPGGAPEAAQQSVEDAAAALEGASAVPAQARVPLAGVCASVMTREPHPHRTIRLAHQTCVRGRHLRPAVLGGQGRLQRQDRALCRPGVARGPFVMSHPCCRRAPPDQRSPREAERARGWRARGCVALAGRRDQLCEDVTPACREQGEGQPYALRPHR